MRPRHPLALLLVAACHAASPSSPGEPAPVAAPPTVDVGRRAPPFRVRRIDGQPGGIAPGKVHLLWFWATWSAPDQKAMPKIEELHDRLADRGLAVLAMSVDDADSAGQIAAFARSYGPRLPVAWDEGHRIADLYRPAAEPTFYVVDRAGVIRHVHGGYHDGEAAVMAAEIEALLDRP